MRIQNNLAAGQTNRFLALNNDNVNKSSEKLSSGYRINNAGDDAAGLAISEKMRAQIRGLDMAVRNSQDATSLIQTAEGALQESTEILKRMRDLAVQSSNGVYDDTVDRAAINKEMDSLKSELDRISTATEFNGKKLLDGSVGGASTGAVVATAATSISVKAETFTLTGVPAGVSVKITSHATATSAAWSGTELAVVLKAGDVISADSLNALMASATGTAPAGAVPKIKLSGDSFTVGAAAQTVTLTATVAKAAEANTAAGGGKLISTKGGTDTRDLIIGAAVAGTESVAIAANGNVTLVLDSNKIYDKDMVNALLKNAGADMEMEFTGVVSGGQALSALAPATISLIGGTGVSRGEGMTFQIGANGFADQRVSLAVDDMSSTGLGVRTLSTATQTSANQAIAVIDKAINKVSSTRADLGALQNRMSHTIKNLNVSKENLTAAESRIRDVDMAAEMTQHTKNNILSQAATAMLAQANQQPQGVLQLLR